MTVAVRAAWVLLVTAAACTRPNPNYCPAGAGQCADGGSEGDAGDDAATLDGPAACPRELLYNTNKDVFGGGDTFRLDLTTFEKTRVSNGVDNDRDAVWSPNGMRLALIRNAQSVWTVADDGTNGHEVVSPPGLLLFFPTWSPDGSRILYEAIPSGGAAGTETIYSAAVAGSGSPALLTVGTQGTGPLTWSPDGARLSFTSKRSGNLDVFVMDADGGNPINVTNRAQDDSAPEWSPDGADLAVVFQGRIWLFAPDGSNPRNLTGTAVNGDSLPHWSHDSTKIFFLRNDELYVMNRDGANQHSTGITGVLDYRPSPDDSEVAWRSTVEELNGEIYVAQVDGSQKTRATSNTEKELFLRWRPCPH